MSTKTEKSQTVVPALASGAVQAVFFNPIDRALYLRVINKRELWTWANFENPFQGFANAAIFRTISSASYLLLQDYARQFLLWLLPNQFDSSPLALQLNVGLLAGTINGLLLNQMQIIKFYCWSTNGSFWSTAGQMRRDGGNRIFFRGVTLSISRDVMFGIVYETMRMPHIWSEYGDTAQFCANTAAGMLACVVGAPINYCRNLVYSTPAASCPLRAQQLISLLVREIERMPTLMEKAKLLNSRMNVGWGSVRVGVGFGVGQQVFKQCKRASTYLEGGSTAPVAGGERK